MRINVLPLLITKVEWQVTLAVGQTYEIKQEITNQCSAASVCWAIPFGASMGNC